jgi:hypothetical protein
MEFILKMLIKLKESMPERPASYIFLEKWQAICVRFELVLKKMGTLKCITRTFS